MTYTPAELNQTGIYVIIHKDTGKRYIGSAARSFRGRWNEHKSDLRKGKHHSPRLQNSWNKYTEFRFEFKILEFVPPEFCIQREQWWMDLFGSYIKEIGYNICPTAGSNLGNFASEETKRKMSLARKGKASPLKGTTRSDEIRKKISEGNRRRAYKPHTPEARAKISKNSAQTKPFTIVSPTGEVISGVNLKAWCRENGFNPKCMNNMTRGVARHYKGWTLPISKVN